MIISPPLLLPLPLLLLPLLYEKLLELQPALEVIEQQEAVLHAVQPIEQVVEAAVALVLVHVPRVAPRVPVRRERQVHVDVQAQHVLGAL